MNNLEAYLVELLQGHLTCNDNPVQVVRQFSQQPTRPVITLDTSPGVSTQHIYPDIPNNATYYERHATVNINIWCDTEEQREYLTQQVLYLFQLEQHYHYMYCANYNPTTSKCTSTNARCGAANQRRNKCPNPVTNNYTSLREKHGIIQGTLNVEPPFELDDLTDHPPLLRSILRCECQYSDVYTGEVVPLQSINVEGVDLVEVSIPVELPHETLIINVDTLNSISFTGVVVDTGGLPVEGVTVTCTVYNKVDDSILWTGTVISDEEGLAQLAFRLLDVQLPNVFSFTAVVDAQTINDTIYSSDMITRDVMM